MSQSRTQKPVLSIVIVTYSRSKRLHKCISGIQENVTTPTEIIVVSRKDNLDTAEWARLQPEIRFIINTNGQQPDSAYYKGFHAATGTYVMWLDDNSFPLPGAIDSAVNMLQHTGMIDVGMIGFYHNHDDELNRFDSIEHNGVIYSTYNVQGLLCTNFGILRRQLLNTLGYLNEESFYYGWEFDLSIKIQRQAGMKVIGCPKALIFQEEMIDKQKMEYMPRLAKDGNKSRRAWKPAAKYKHPATATDNQRTILKQALIQS
ncbi:MAG: glycosyltransferase family 2 protein [Planctomycetota bacterium]|nr:MAG: glycosyltransferase family 2 protein [Planctomycetota bacterium]